MMMMMMNLIATAIYMSVNVRGKEGVLYFVYIVGERMDVPSDLPNSRNLVARMYFPFRYDGIHNCHICKTHNIDM